MSSTISQWADILNIEREQPYFRELEGFLESERHHHRIFPPEVLVFNALRLTPLAQVKVVILGQDPYHQPGQAHGLAFSVPEGVKIPPSLKNIFKELASDMPGFGAPLHGDLTSWAKQGVLLLNSILTVRAGAAGSHHQKGWERLTDQLIRQISAQKNHAVFLLWGKYAQEKAVLIDSEKHCVLSGPHPSPLSAYKGFLGCGHFSMTNAYLVSKGLQPIDWRLASHPTLLPY